MSGKRVVWILVVIILVVGGSVAYVARVTANARKAARESAGAPSAPANAPPPSAPRGSAAP